MTDMEKFLIALMETLPLLEPVGYEETELPEIPIGFFDDDYVPPFTWEEK